LCGGTGVGRPRTGPTSSLFGDLAFAADPCPTREPWTPCYNREAAILFVKRIWHEQTDAAQGRCIWRCWAQHTRSGESICAQRAQQMSAFTERCIGQLSSENKMGSRLK